MHPSSIEGPGNRKAPRAAYVGSRAGGPRLLERLLGQQRRSLAP